MGVPVVAFPIGGQAELIGVTPSASFLAERVSAKTFIRAVRHVASINPQEALKLREDIALTAKRINSGPTLAYALSDALS